MLLFLPPSPVFFQNYFFSVSLSSYYNNYYMFEFIPVQTPDILEPFLLMIN